MCLRGCVQVYMCVHMEARFGHAPSSVILYLMFETGLFTQPDPAPIQQFLIHANMLSFMWVLEVFMLA